MPRRPRVESPSVIREGIAPVSRSLTVDRATPACGHSLAAESQLRSCAAAYCANGHEVPAPNDQSLGEVRFTAALIGNARLRPGEVSLARPRVSHEHSPVSTSWCHWFEPNTAHQGPPNQAETAW